MRIIRGDCYSFRDGVGLQNRRTAVRVIRAPAAQNWRKRKKRFVLAKELVTVFSEPTTATEFVTSDQLVGTSASVDWSTKNPGALVGHEIAIVLPVCAIRSNGGGCGMTTRTWSR